MAWLGRGLGGAEWLTASDGRYQRDGELRLEALDEANRTDWLKQFCGQFDGWLPPADAGVCAEYRKTDLIAKLLGKIQTVGHSAWPVNADTRARLGEFVLQMQAGHDAWAKSFFLPLESVEHEHGEWLKKAQEGFIEEDSQAELTRLEAKTQVYRDTFKLNVRHEAAYSRPVECAWVYLSRRAALPVDDARPVLAVAGLAAVLDGNKKRLPDGAFADAAVTRNPPVTPTLKAVELSQIPSPPAPLPQAGEGSKKHLSLAAGRANSTALNPATLPTGDELGWDATEKGDRCQDSVEPKGQTSPLEAAQAAASILRLAHASAGNAAKADATLAMLPKLWRSLLVWALAGLLVLHLGRRPSRTLGISLLVWAVAYALTRPHLEWLGLGGLLKGWLPVAWLVGAAALFWRIQTRSDDRLALTASRCAYPGFVLFTGLGWLLLADLSTYAYHDNRFHAIYQQAYVFLAFMLASLLPSVSIPLARFGLGLWTLPTLWAAGRIKRTLIGWGLGLIFALVLLGLTKLFLTSHRQNTSEIFRFILLSGLAWFLLTRAEALGSPWLSLVQNRPWWRKSTLALRLSLWGLRVKLALPLLLLLGFVAGGFWVTQDKGPLLVVLYAGAIFFSLFVARLITGEKLGLGLGLLSILPYVWLVSYALFLFGGGFGEYIAERLESAQTPFLASNDQIAHILWFQEAALDNGGFDLGFSPWCGELSGACRGVPPQIQSDYIYTALVGVFGNASGVLFSTLAFLSHRRELIQQGIPVTAR